jgi:hypothetical protein
MACLIAYADTGQGLDGKPRRTPNHVAATERRLSGSVRLASSTAIGTYRMVSVALLGVVWTARRTAGTLGLLAWMIAISSACGGSPSAEDRALARAEKTPLPVAAQPANPCHLLTPEEVRSVMGVALPLARDAELATERSGQRVCLWSSKRGMLDLDITTQPALHAVAEATSRIVGRPVHESTVQSLFGGKAGSSGSLPSLGDAARVTEFASGDAILTVLSGTTLVRLHSTGLHQSDATTRLVALARLVLKALANAPTA